MPTYEYKCAGCGATFDALQLMSDPPLESCRVCSSPSIAKTITAPMLNTLRSTSPTGAKYEKMTTRELINKEGPRLAEIQKQEGLEEKIRLMYSGKLD